LEFQEGTIVSLTKLLPGQRAVVLQLPAEYQDGVPGSANAETGSVEAVS
jgi:hypothetical protein